MFFILLFDKIKNVLSTLFSRFFFRLCGVKLGDGIIFKGVPNIWKVKKGKISIGENTMINSSNFGYHLNMFSKCKLLADRVTSEIIIGKNCRIHGTCIHAYSKIEIGNNCLIAANTNIIDGNGHLLSFDNVSNRIKTVDNGKPIHIGDNVWIGANCLVLGGISIGEGSVVAANSVVNKSIPSNCLVAGNPAKIIKNYNNENSDITR